MEDYIGVVYADKYQYAMVAFLWVVITPLAMLMYAVLARDNVKLIILPIVIANVVFMILMSILTLIVIYYTLMYTTVEGQVELQLYYLGALVIAMINMKIYGKYMSRKDVL
jgi:hypothetical protein